MAPYLSNPSGMDSSPFPEGGALYALGLIHVNHGEGIKQYLLERLRLTGSEVPASFQLIFTLHLPLTNLCCFDLQVVQHGACLALGLASLGTGDPEVYEELRSVLHSDSAVAGEAAGLAMGLLMVGSASERAQEMMDYARDTQHEKIIRYAICNTRPSTLRFPKTLKCLGEQGTCPGPCPHGLCSRRGSRAINSANDHESGPHLALWRHVCHWHGIQGHRK